MGKYEKEKLKPKNNNKTRIDQQSCRPEKLHTDKEKVARLESECGRVQDGVVDGRVQDVDSEIAKLTLPTFDESSSWSE